MRLNQGEIRSEFQCSDLFEMLNSKKNNVTFPGFRLILFGFSNLQIGFWGTIGMLVKVIRSTVLGC